jgi:hypothetical protein
MDMDKFLTKEKTDAFCEKISKGLEENKIVGSACIPILFQVWHPP